MPAGRRRDKARAMAFVCRTRRGVGREPLGRKRQVWFAPTARRAAISPPPFARTRVGVVGGVANAPSPELEWI